VSSIARPYGIGFYQNPQLCSPEALIKIINRNTLKVGGFMSESARDILLRYLPDFPANHCGRIFRDTSQFMSISYGDVISLNGLHYLTIRDEAERRFGLEDPKYWVKRCRVLETGERKILKLVFHENFPLKIGPIEVRCFRSPEKEARILKFVQGDDRFMQGTPTHDERGNVVRVIDIIRGKRIDDFVESLEADHKTYFHEFFPSILEGFILSCEAIAYLHQNYEHHGDIRGDHLLVEYKTGRYRWIDFDYTFEIHENPFGLDIFGLGNILEFLVGKREHNVPQLMEEGVPREIIASIGPEDHSLMFPNRIVNLKKVYPYIPDELNRVLLHFSAGTYVFYDSVTELLEDLCPSVELVRRL
jgi:hypothetical protein